MKGMSRVSCIDDVPRRNERGQRIAVLVPLLHYIVLLLLLCRRDELTLTTVTAFAFQQPRYMLHPRGTATLGSSTRRFSVSPPTSNPPTREDKATTATPSGTAKRLDLSSIERRSDEEMFDPFDFPSTKMMEPVDIASHMILATNKEEQAKNEELGIWAARALLLLVAMIWGTNFASVKYLENLCFDPPCNHPPSEAAFARFGLAAAVSLPLLINQRWNVIKAGLECGVWISLGYASQAMALSTIDSGKCAFICSLTVVFVPVMSSLVYGKKMKASNIVAALVALAGVGVMEGLLDVNTLLMGISPAVAAETTHTIASSAASMVASSGVDMTHAVATSTVHSAAASGAMAEATTGPLASLAKGLGVNEGDILALGQPIGFGTAFTRIERYQEELKDVPNRILTIAAAQCVAVGIFSFLWVLYDFNGVIPNMAYMAEPHRIAAIVWTGIVTTVVAIYIEGVALQKATATDASLAFSTEPVWASMFGFLLLHETLGSESYVGGAVILLACLIGAASDLSSSTSDNKTSNEI